MELNNIDPRNEGLRNLHELVTSIGKPEDKAIPIVLDGSPNPYHQPKFVVFDNGICSFWLHWLGRAPFWDIQLLGRLRRPSSRPGESRACCDCSQDWALVQQLGACMRNPRTIDYAVD